MIGDPQSSGRRKRRAETVEPRPRRADDTPFAARIAARGFEWLLPLYPGELRAEYGVEMARAFRDQVRHARSQRGALAAFGVWFKALTDVLGTWRAARRDRRAAGRRAGLSDHRSSGARPEGASASLHSNHPAPPGNPMESLVNDLRHGLRSLLHDPAVSLAATLTLAIGVGASVTMFSGLSNFVLDPLPYGQQERLYALYSVLPARGDAEVDVSYPDYLDFRDAGIFDHSAAYYPVGFNLAGVDQPVRIDALRAGAGLFDALGVEAEIGRVFSAEEERIDAAVLVISDALWQRQFGADPGVVGTTVLLDGDPFTVIGVMPEGFWFPSPQYEAWIPLDLRPTSTGRDARFLGVVGRLAPGIGADEAQASVSAVARRLAGAEPETNRGFEAAHLTPLSSQIIWDEMRMSLYMLTITGVLVLLISCVNVANLLVAKGMARRRELAVRAALGAGRLRLIRQYLAENLVLGLAGGALGLIVARFGISGIGAALAANEPGRVPRLQEYLEAGLDGRVIVFALAASIGAVLLFALVPALHGTRGDLHDNLRDNTRSGSGRGSRRLQKSLVVAELALTLALLIGAGLTLRSHAVVMQTDPGMQRDGLLTMAVALSGARYAEDHAAADFFDRATERLGALPGVDGAAATSSLPNARQGNFRSFEIEGRPADDPADAPRLNYVVTTPGYFDVLGAPLARGRPLRVTDDEGSAPVAVINETVVRRYFGDENPIGERMRPLSSPDGTWIEIVGVVADFRNNGLHRPTWPAVYVPLQQASARRMSLVLRSAGDPLQQATPARTALAEIDADLPLFRVQSMQQVFDSRFWGETLTMNLLSWCALGALLLAIVGIYGVISYSVAQRTREMGIRIALGARAGNVVGLVVRQGLWLAVLGIGIGLLLGFGLSRGLSFMLFGVSGNDPVTYASVVGLLALIAALASYLPARRATRVDPMVALRDE